MTTEPEDYSARLLRLLRSVIAIILPRGIREEYMGDLNRYPSLAEFVPQPVVTLVAGYRIQAIGAFNKAATLAEIGCVVFCFSAASLPLPLFIVLVGILGTLTFRDAFRHPVKGSDPVEKEDLPTTSQYYLDLAGDAATTAVFLFTSQMVMLKRSPSLSLPKGSIPGRFHFPPIAVHAAHGFAAQTRRQNAVRRIESVG